MAFRHSFLRNTSRRSLTHQGIGLLPLNALRVGVLPLGLLWLSAGVMGCGDDAGVEASTTNPSASNMSTAGMAPPPLAPTGSGPATSGGPTNTATPNMPNPVPAPVNPASPGSATPEPEDEPEAPAVTPEPEDEPEAPTAVDCSAFEDNGDWELCDSSATQCGVVFNDGAGCASVCAAAGLVCSEVWENAEACGPDTSQPASSCDAASGHQSDYCVCTSDGSPGVSIPPVEAEPETPTEPEPTQEPETPVEPEAPTEPEPVQEPETPVEPEAVPEPEAQPEPEAAQPEVGPRECECETPAGEWGTVNETIVVRSGEVYDGNCQIFRANTGTLGNGSQDEGQSPVFVVEGGTLRNVVIGASGADGIHVEGNALLENIHWLDIGEDALTIVGSGNVTLDCGSAAEGEDKVFQINAESEFHISNFTARNAGKFIRQNGQTTFTTNVTIDHSDISNMGEVIFRTDSASSHVTLTNSRYSNLGDGLFIFGTSTVNGNSNQSTVSNNQEY